MLFPEFNPRPPAAFADRLNYRQDRWLRMQAGLFVMARTGFGTAGEMFSLLGEYLNLPPESYALQRILREYLPQAGLAEYSVLPFFRYGLACTRLTSFGAALCHALKWGVRESEWGRLIELHEGEKQGKHTAMILMFARQARLRGYRVNLLPEVVGAPNGFVPDVYVVDKKHRRAYVEVERGHAKQDKWRSLAALQGFVALVTLTPRHRQTLVEEVQELRLPGRATDLQTLLRAAQDGRLNWLFPQRWDAQGRTVERRQPQGGR